MNAQLFPVGMEFRTMNNLELLLLGIELDSAVYVSVFCDSL